MERFKLSKTFLEQYKDKQPNWGPLGYVTYKRTYARQIEDESRTEEYHETIERVINGVYSLQKIHARNLRLPWNDQKAQRSAQKMFELMWEFKFLPPGRGLFQAGTDFVFERGSASLQNCGVISTDEINTDFARPFAWMMDMLMLGVGVSGDTAGAGKVTIQVPEASSEPFVIPDSREGWVEALTMVLESFVGKQKLRPLDASLIRPKGAPIRGFGGIASGPGPLLDSLKEIITVLHPKFNGSESYKIRSDQIVDIFNLVGRCVVAGGVRRTAELMLGDPEDEVFLNLKQDEEKLKSHRWASNNSVIGTVGMDYTKIAEAAAVNGEPGVLFLDNARAYGRMIDPPNYKDRRIVNFNPCAEQPLESGEMCTLCETFPSNHETLSDWIATLKYAYLYAKSVTLLTTHNERTNAIMARNRRIGLSVSGIIDAFNKFGRRNVLQAMDEGYNKVNYWDQTYSDWLAIPRSIKKTTVKPSGTVSLLAGVSPGIHYPHAEYYVRRMRMRDDSPLLKILEEAGYEIEDDYYSPNTKVVEFPIHEKHFTKGKEDASVWEQVKNAADLQKYWSDNAVSITVTVKDKEKSEIKPVLEAFEDSLKSISFLPTISVSKYSRKNGYKQAPYEEIDEITYNSIVENIKEIKYENLNGNGKVHDQDEKFCTNDSCELV